MNHVFVYTGMAVWAVVALGVLWLLVEIAVGMLCAASYHRWIYRDARVNGRKLSWMKLPVSYLQEVGRFAGYRNNGSTTVMSESGSQWHGIGDWTVLVGPKVTPSSNN